MGALIDLLDTIIDIGDLYARYGVKGCALIVLAIILSIAIIIVLAMVLA